MCHRRQAMGIAQGDSGSQGRSRQSARSGRIRAASWKGHLAGFQEVRSIARRVTSATVQLCVQYVTCDVFFDNLVIDVEAPVVVANPDGPKPAATTPAADPANPAAKAPKKTLDDGGMTFGPDYA